MDEYEQSHTKFNLIFLVVKTRQKNLTSFYVRPDVNIFVKNYCFLFNIRQIIIILLTYFILLGILDE